MLAAVYLYLNVGSILFNEKHPFEKQISSNKNIVHQI